MKLKKGDKVIVIAGKDKGEKGTIARVLVAENKVLIDGINVAKRHRRRTAQSKSGQIIDKAMPIHVSNVMLIDPKTGKPTRIRIVREEGVRSRVTVQSSTKLS